MMNLVEVAESSPRVLETRVLEELFQGLSARSISFAVLRNYERLPESLGARDLDLIVEPAHLPAAVGVVRTIAESNELQFANYFRDERLTQFTLFKRLSPSAIFEIKIDFFTSSQVYGIEALSASQMLEDACDHRGIPVVSDAVKLLDKWLFHLMVGKPLHAKYDKAFAAIASDENAKAIISSKLCLLFDQGLAAMQIARLAAGQGSKLLPLSRRVRFMAIARLWRAQGFSAFVRTLGFLFFRLRDRLRPAGSFLSVSGPDGCGKTTVIDKIKVQLECVFGEQSVAYRHFRPSILPRIASIAKSAKAIDRIDENYGEPHRAMPSGFVGSLARSAYYWIDYQIGYFRETHEKLTRREVMLFDRYIFDMVADPGRSRISLPNWILRVIAYLTIRPKYAFFIRVPAAVVRERKQELSLDAIEILNGRYQDLADRKLLIAVDNVSDAETSAATIVDMIVADRDRLARRKIENF
ncbi:hypothetical protein [Qipengyuania gaetbuli]|uniref:hypothetical protein n=1 Tax=Qipengyuania gaetbuli TaxID=266952 RepID=UPI001CD46BE0|nr:hypothetical protein [Qipengyuania gaetbuli]MCA0911033.1 hypothetical protein [Qipengyuania gaetbuli]